MKRRPAILAVSLLLALATFCAYWPVRSHKFVEFDDAQYIGDNPHVKAGLTWGGVLWAFTSGYASNWHPLTWISHMADCQLYGLNPAGHHLTNVFFHLVNSVLLFLLLHRITSALWRSAFVAALFSLHPLHVESVAWAAERKDVLSTLFFLLALWAYARYAESRSAKPEVLAMTTSGAPPLRQPSSSAFYLLALGLFAMGLMSKPMLVTLPFVLLLLDFWPLQRIGLPVRRSTLGPLVREKLPFFALALAAAAVTYLVQQTGGAVSTLDLLPLHSRAANALVAYGRYLALTLWPADLAVLYPYSRHLALGALIATALLLAGFSAWFVSRARRQPFLIVGWLWFLGTLVPTIGLVQVGSQSMADRYTYIPSIGLFVLIVWGLADSLVRWPQVQRLLPAAGVILLAACWVCTQRQLSHWRDNESLFRRAVEVTEDNYIAYNGLGSALEAKGKSDEALACYLEAVRIKPRYSEGQYDLGLALLRRGKLDDAIHHFNAAIAANPGFAHAHINLGKALLDQGKLEEAAIPLSKAVQLTPKDPEAHYNLGTLLVMQGDLDKAVACFSAAVRLNPAYSEAHGNLGIALMRQGKFADGVTHFATAVKLSPANPQAHDNLGLALLELNQPAAAADQFSESLRLQPDSAAAHYHLALALTRQNKPQEAVPHAEKALALANATGQTALIRKAQELLRPH